MLPTAVPFPGADLGATLDQKLKRAELPVDAVLSTIGGPTNALIQLNLTQPKILTFYTFYFPGWRVYVDGVKTSIEFQDPNSRGLITYNVSKGEHNVKIVFEDTKVRLLGKILSLFFIGVFLVAILFRKRIKLFWSKL